MLSLHLLVAHWCFILISSQNSPTNINDKCESSDEIPDARTIQAHHSIRFVLNDTFHHLPRSNQSQPIIILDKCNKIVYIMRINNKKYAHQFNTSKDSLFTLHPDPLSHDSVFTTACRKELCIAQLRLSCFIVLFYLLKLQFGKLLKRVMYRIDLLLFEVMRFNAQDVYAIVSFLTFALSFCTATCVGCLYMETSNPMFIQMFLVICVDIVAMVIKYCYVNYCCHSLNISGWWTPVEVMLNMDEKLMLLLWLTMLHSLDYISDVLQSNAIDHENDVSTEEVVEEFIVFCSNVIDFILRGHNE
eukprot:261118_1